MGNISYNTIMKNKRLGEFFDEETLGVDKSEQEEDEVL